MQIPVKIPNELQENFERQFSELRNKINQQKKHSTTGIKILKKIKFWSQNFKEMKNALKAREIEQITWKRELVC